MARKSDPGINYYPLKTNHITNRKIRLLINEHGSDGYWVWSCLVATMYEDKGYYFDLSDKEDLEFFASEKCKLPCPLVENIIKTCIRKGLFDAEIYERLQILTSDRIQLTYISATKERRKKSSEIEICKELLLVNIENEWKNIIITENNFNIPEKNVITPGNNPQKKRKESKRKEMKGDSAGEPADSTPADNDSILKNYRALTKTKRSIHDFIVQHKPVFIEPYYDLWNIWAGENHLPKMIALNDTRKKKFYVRLKEPTFSFIDILKKAKESEFIHKSKWFTFDWIVENDRNYIKVLEGNFDNNVSDEKKQSAISTANRFQQARENAEQFERPEIS